MTEVKKKPAAKKSVQSTSIFDTLSRVNINEKTEKKKNLTYLSWTFAWSEVKKAFPSATYKVYKDELGNPYTFDASLGFMCYTEVTIDNETLEMWLPVMNGANKAMRKESYTYSTKHGEKTVEAATMFDINKTIMRCLVKNIAMFGLGLYIFSGEDLPEEDPTKPLAKPEPKPVAKELPKTNSQLSLEACETVAALGTAYKALSKADQTKYKGITNRLKAKLQAAELLAKSKIKEDKSK